MSTGSALPLFALLAGCSFFDTQLDWSEQVVPSGPCFEVNLVDGIDRSSPAASAQEFHALYDCLDQNGALAPLGRFDAALDAPTRTGTVTTDLLDTAEAIAASSSGDPAGGPSLAGLLDGALALFDDREALESYLRLTLELVYAVPVDQLGTAVSINSETALADGLVVPLLDTGAAVASATLDADLEPLSPLAEALRSDAASRLAWTLVLLPEAPDPALATLGTDWPGLFAGLLDATTDTGNDRNPGPTGDSLRDLVTAMLAADALVSVGDAFRPALEDSFTRDQLRRMILDEADAGRLSTLDVGAYYLASVDVDGGSLSEGEDSALVALVRLFRDGNQPVDCSVDLGITEIEFSLGNLSVAILTQLATLDPDTAASGVDILGDVVDYPLTDAILQSVADSGVCPVIDDQLVSDLGAVDRLSDPATDDLLRTLLAFLDATDDHIPEVADLASALHDHQLVEPMEELLRDVAGSSFTEALLDALPGLVEPEGHQAVDAFPEGVEPLDFESLVDIGLSATKADDVEALSPVIDAAVAQSSTWTALHNARYLLLQSGTEVSQALGLLRTALEADPTLALLPDLARRVDDPAITRPALSLVESEAVQGAIADTELTDEGALPWLARLYVGGTVDVILDTLTLFRDLVPSDEP